MTTKEFNEIISTTHELQFETLTVITDNGERATFDNGEIFYIAKGDYYYLKVRGYIHYSENGNEIGCSQHIVYVTIYRKIVTDITYK